MKPATLLLIGLLATTTGALAQQRPAPGLWENSMTMKSGPGAEAMKQMQDQLASMPAAQRKQMEAMLSQRGMSAGPGQVTVKVCITPEQAARDEMPQSDSKCKQTRNERSGNTLRFAFTCENGSSGEGEYTFANPKAHSGKLIVNSVHNGKTQRSEMLHTGRWLGADCGAVKSRP